MAHVNQMGIWKTSKDCDTESCTNSDSEIDDEPVAEEAATAAVDDVSANIVTQHEPRRSARVRTAAKRLTYA